MTAKRQLGTILLESGRINQTDVDRVLEYQRANGGYFGQGIVALGILRSEEIDWALASQFDLPFIFPNSETVDRDVALLVPADWALAHLAVPIVRAGRALTVVVADPLDNETLDDLHSRTGLDVEMALASAPRIRELIRTLYGDSGHVKPSDATPVALSEFMTRALDVGADRIGISVRSAHATGWFTARSGHERRQLLEGWATILEDMLDPSPLDAAGGSKNMINRFDATLCRPGVDIAVDVQVMGGKSGTEFLLRPIGSSASHRHGIVLPPSVAAELRLLARGGNAHVAVSAADPEIQSDLAPQLPAFTFGDSVRAAHVTEHDEPSGIYTLRADGAGEEFIAALESYEFDAVSVDLPLGDARLPRILAAAPISFLRVDRTNLQDDSAALRESGINWILLVSRDQDVLAWELRPVNR
jgi:hypothetical protein